MTTVVDTNVLVALWDPRDTLNTAAGIALTVALKAGALVVPGPVFSELLALPGRTEQFLDQFFNDSGIALDCVLPEPVWRQAGLAFQSHVRSRRAQSGQQPRRLLADFLIGAYAVHRRARLLTLDRRHYRSAFPDLELVTF